MHRCWEHALDQPTRVCEESESSEWGSNHLCVQPTLTTLYVSLWPSHWGRLIKAWKSHMPSYKVLFLLCSSSQFVLENEDPFWWLRLTPAENFACVDYRIQTGWENAARIIVSFLSLTPPCSLPFSLGISPALSTITSPSFAFVFLFILSFSLSCVLPLCARTLSVSLSLAFALFLSKTNAST